MVCGPDGIGPPEADASRVSFNGNADMDGAERTAIAHLFRTYGEDWYADWLMKTPISKFDEWPLTIEPAVTWQFESPPGRYHQEIHPRSAPYEVAVTAALILLATIFLRCV
jgi:hypothetical protein